MYSLFWPSLTLHHATRRTSTMPSGETINTRTEKSRENVGRCEEKPRPGLPVSQSRNSD